MALGQVMPRDFSAQKLIKDIKDKKKIGSIVQTLQKSNVDVN